jgi:hypothetical protein
MLSNIIAWARLEYFLCRIVRLKVINNETLPYSVGIADIFSGINGSNSHSN